MRHPHPLPSDMTLSARALPLILLAFWSQAGVARQSDEACMALRSARIHLMAFVGARDIVSQTNHRHRIQEASRRLDDLLTAMAQDPEAPRVRSFRPVWEAFKHTRETEIIPAVLAGEQNKARQIALGVQGTRIARMKQAMGCP